MLEGKPAGENEQVTMEAIKSILAETAGAGPGAGRPSKGMRLRKRAASFIATLQPVTEVEERAGEARFTTVPPSTGLSPGEGTAQTIDIADTEAGSLSGKAAEVFAPLVAPDVSDKGTAPTTVAQKKVPRTPAPRRKAGRVWRLILLTGFAVLVVQYPYWVLGAVAAWFMLAIGAFLTIGADRVWTALEWLVHGYARMRPSAAVGTYAWLDSVAFRWDAVLDCFPDGMVDSLYMPDFGHASPIHTDPAGD